MRDLPPGVLAQLPLFIALHNLKGDLVYASRFGFGLNPKTVLNKLSDTVVHPDDKPIWWATFRRVVEFGETVEYALRVIVPTKPGFATIAGHLGPIYHRGKLRWVYAAVHDETFRRKPNPLAKHILSPLSKRMVTALLDGPKTTTALARAVREATRNGRPSTTFKVSLKALVERGILEKCGGGNCITEAFRPLISEYSLINPSQ